MLSETDFKVVASGRVHLTISDENQVDYKWILYKQQDTEHYVLIVTGLGSYMWGSVWTLITELAHKVMGFDEPEICIVSPVGYDTLAFAIHRSGLTHVTSHWFRIGMN